jgi:oligopeptide/dipeptide ABC transporter ATP-binding protein
VLNLMKRLQASHGLSYIVISHDLAVVRYLANRIGVMYLGRMVEVGSADDIHLRAAHPYTAGLLEAVPAPDPELERAKRGAGISGELPSPLAPPSGCRFRTRCPLARERCAHEAGEPGSRQLRLTRAVALRRPMDARKHALACLFPARRPESWHKPWQAHQDRCSARSAGTTGPGTAAPTSYSRLPADDRERHCLTRERSATVHTGHPKRPRCQIRARWGGKPRTPAFPRPDSRPCSTS